MSDLGFGVIGAGRIGQLHARNLAGSIAGAQLIGVMDANLTAAETAAGRNAYATTKLEQLLADERIDAVLIASPTTLDRKSVV